MAVDNLKPVPAPIAPSTTAWGPAGQGGTAPLDRSMIQRNGITVNKRTTLGPIKDVKAFRSYWAAKLAADPLARRVVSTLWRKRDSYAGPVVERTRSENPIIAAVLVGEAIQHAREHFRALLALATRRSSALVRDPLAFVSAHGVRRARGGVPLRAVLQGYRTGHKVFWESMCTVINRLAPNAEAGLRTAMLLSDYCIEYTDLISIVVADAYVVEEAKLAGERARLGIAVIASLLKGVLPSSDLGGRMCERAGFGNGLHMVVLVVRGEDRRDDGSVAACEPSDLVSAIELALPRGNFGRLIEADAGGAVAVVSCAKSPGASATSALRVNPGCRTLCQAGRLRIGVGLDVNSIAELPRSHKEAQVAIALLGTTQTIGHLAEVSVQDYLRLTADETAYRLMPALAAEVRTGPLAQTLEAFAAADMNVKACAQRLGLHSNTIYNHLNRVRRQTGLDPRSFLGLSLLILALRLGSSIVRNRFDVSVGSSWGAQP
jgi:hypothetical protein